MIREAINIAVLTIFLIFAVNAEAADPAPHELRDLLVYSIIVDLQFLKNVEGADAHVVSLTKKLSALLRSYEVTTQTQWSVIERYIDLLDQNNIPIR